jgi:hypothetical protein
MHKLERVATHEAGHCIAALNFGLPVKTVTIDGHPHMHRDRFRRERSSATEALAIVCLSGPAAEELFFGPANDGGDHIDRQMARRYLRDCFPDSEIGYQLTRMRYAAERLVTSEQTKITTVATAAMRLQSCLMARPRRFAARRPGLHSASNMSCAPSVTFSSPEKIRQPVGDEEEVGDRISLSNT